MEQTEHRKAFFAEVHLDPYATMILTLMSQAWADGYEQAVRDAGGHLREGHSDLRRRGVEWITDEGRTAEAHMVIAMAEIGKLSFKSPGPK